MSEQKTATRKIICQGGLNSNRNYLDLSDNSPGAAIALQNFEPSLYGGYRRIEGYEPLEDDYAEVDPSGAEGKIYVTAIYDDTIIVARKQKSGDTYEFYYWTAGSDWTKYTTGLTLSSISVDKIRWVTFNFDGTEKIIFVDGVNNAILYDGTDWVQIDPSDTGADFANAGGAQALEAPKYVTVFRNHIFLSGDATDPHVIAHSAPNAEYDWTSGNGAGQLNAGFIVAQIKPFRDDNFVFGQTKIRKIVVDNTLNFVIQDVAKNIGCIASDSVIEVNGDLVFLSQDGFRTVAATERIGDIELGILSKNIQQDITDLIASSVLTQVECVLIRRKSQIRLFFSSSSVEQKDTYGVIAGLRNLNGDMTWEWGRLKGIRASSVASGYINNIEYVIHGDYNGKVYRQERGNSFDGAKIPAVYTTPYLDFDDTEIRKTFRTINLFVRPEGSVFISGRITYDWGDPNLFSPSDYYFQTDIELPTYGTAIYGTSVYAGSTVPLLASNVEGSGRSISIRFSSEDTNPSYSIQSLVFELSPNDRK